MQTELGSKFFRDKMGVVSVPSRCSCIQNTKYKTHTGKTKASKKITTDLSTDALLELRHSVIMLLLLPRHDRVLRISICKQQNTERKSARSLLRGLPSSNPKTQDLKKPGVKRSLTMVITSTNHGYNS
jgi:hypothetical protein